VTHDEAYPRLAELVGSAPPSASFPLELGGVLNDWVVAPNVNSYRAVDLTRHRAP
jgi:hypothetical protein